MEFIQKLQKQKEAKMTANFRCLNAIKAGNYKLSIQGSTGHYCSPRKTLLPYQYDRMELAILNERGSMVSANRSKVLKEFPWYKELIERAANLNTGATVYVYLPVETINKLYLYLSAK